MNWFIAAIANPIFFAGGAIIEKHIANTDIEPIHLAFISCFASMVSGLSIALITGNLTVPHNLSAYILLFFAALSVGFANVTFYQAMKHSDISEFELLMKFTVLLQVLGGFLFYGERFTYIQIVGMILLFIGIGVLTIKNNTIHISYGSKMALLTAVLFGIGSLFDKQIVHLFSPAMYTFFIFLGICITLVPFILYTHAKRPLQRVSLMTVIIICIAAISYSLSSVMYNIALTKGPLSIIGLVSQLQLPIVVLAGYFLFQERDRLIQKSISLGAMLIGVVLLQ